MARGDKRTKRGKIAAGSYGNTRPHRKKKRVKPSGTKPRTGKK